MVGIAGVAFVAIFVFHVPFPVDRARRGRLGLVGARVRPRLRRRATARAEATDGWPCCDDAPPPHTRARRSRGASVLSSAGVWLIPSWWSRLAWAGDASYGQGLFFSKAAMVTFGGAYAVLAYVQQAVVEYGWLAARARWCSASALAETTRGQLIMVPEFVAFVGAYQHPGDRSPLPRGMLDSMVATWVTFVPCFL